MRERESFNFAQIEINDDVWCVCFYYNLDDVMGATNNRIGIFKNNVSISYDVDSNDALRYTDVDN